MIASPKRTFGAAPFAGAGIAPRSIVKPAAAYPGAVATDADLIVAVNRQTTRLAVSLNATDTSMTVVDPTVVVAYNLLSIDNEIVKTMGPPIGNLVPIQRGFDGTTAAIHLANAQVAGLVDAFHHNRLASEIEAIEAALGPNLSSIPSLAFLVSSQYNFPVQSPAGALVVGNNSITLTPVPKGVNGTDVGHYLYVAGTGTPEAVLITGGSGTSGSASGAIIIQCAFSHPAGWTISSASGGIQEALVAASAAGGGTVYVSVGSTTIRGTVRVPPGSCLIGFGSATVLIPGSASQTMFTFAPAGYNGGRVSNLTVDASSFTGINSVKAFYGSGVQEICFDHIWLNNVRYGFYFTAECWDIDIRTIFTIDNTGMYYGDDTGLTYSWNCNLDGWYSHYRSGMLAMPMITLERAVACNITNVNGQTLNGTMTGILLNNDCQGVVIENVILAAPLIGIDIASDPVSGHAGAGPNWCTYNNIGIDQAVSYAIRIKTASSWSSYTNIMITGLAPGGIGMNNRANSIGNTYTNLNIEGYDNTVGFLADNDSRNWSIENSYFEMSGPAAIGVKINGGSNMFRVSDSLFEGSGIPISDASGGSVQKILSGNQNTAPTQITQQDIYSLNEDYQIGARNIILGGGLSILSYSAASLVNGANQNVVTSNRSYLRLGGPTGAFSIGGFQGGVDGKLLLAWNASGQAMTLSHEDAGSTAANRITTLSGAPVVLAVGNSFASFIYDGPTARWVLMSHQP